MRSDSAPPGARAPGAATRSTRVAYADVTVDVAADDGSALAWLAEFLGPAFVVAPADGRAADRTVAFATDRSAHDDLLARLAASSLDGIEGFTLDGQFSRHRGVRDASGRLWIHDDGAASFHGVDPRDGSIRIVATAGDGRARVGLMRVVREVVTSAMLRAGRLPLHGAAFAVAGRTVLACGPKRSGKTSLLAHALRSGLAFVSNDRVFADVGPPATARAMPTIVMLRNGTLERFPDLAAAYDRARFDRARTIGECAAGIDRPAPTARPGHDRPGISPPQFCRLLGAPMEAGGAIGTILFPRIDATARGAAFHPLPPDDVADRLKGCLLLPSRPGRSSPTFGTGAVVPESAATALCRRLAEQVAAYECRLGPDAYLRADLGDVLAATARATSPPTSPRGPSGPVPRPRT